MTPLVCQGNSPSGPAAAQLHAAIRMHAAITSAGLMRFMAFSFDTHAKPAAKAPRVPVTNR